MAMFASEQELPIAKVQQLPIATATFIAPENATTIEPLDVHEIIIRSTTPVAQASVPLTTAYFITANAVVTRAEYDHLITECNRLRAAINQLQEEQAELEERNNTQFSTGFMSWCAVGCNLASEIVSSDCNHHCLQGNCTPNPAFSADDRYYHKVCYGCVIGSCCIAGGMLGCVYGCPAPGSIHW